MSKLIITGGKSLTGEVKISGGKNSAVAILPAAILCDEPCTIENVPNIEDINSIIDILRHLGAEAKYIKSNTLYIDPSKINKTDVPNELSNKLRASYYFLGSLIGKYGEASVGTLGGCDFGGRPINLHIDGFNALNIQIDSNENSIIAKSKTIIGTDFKFEVVSVGATINVMLAAVRAQGQTILRNAAKEPHIVDLANFLNSMGANVRGAGSDVIKIYGVNRLRSAAYPVVPDQIETGTMMIAAAATHGKVSIINCIPTHMQALSANLLQLGVKVAEYGDIIEVSPLVKHRKLDIITQVYPGFPTDLQQPMTSLLTTVDGESTITETIYDKRFEHLTGLRKMGADIVRNSNKITINGVHQLKGANVKATDLRAGAALIIAGLMAYGSTEVSGLELIDRGYDSIEKKLQLLGADIFRV